MSEGLRRLAAIMYTDMVGYTVLGQKNEALSLALVEEQRNVIRPILARHNGREIKTMGDAFLVEFASALNAVRCAYDIQRATREFNIAMPEERRIHLRIGVHLGDVVESRGDISGDAVNIAARIESLAEDGGVCLTRQVYDHVQNKFELPLISLGSKSLKNINEPMEVYRLSLPWDREKEYSSKVLDKRRIAVLPFANMSPDPNDEYFADGMTEELISSLSRIRGLKVISRTSVMPYKKANKNVAQIAKELGVGTILEGSVRKASRDLRIAVQLIDVQSDEHLWSQDYDRKLEHVFAIQREVALRVARAMKVQLFSEIAGPEGDPTDDIDAYALYLKGRFAFNKGTKDEMEKSIECYHQALEKDPNYALAYSGMAEAYRTMGFLNYLPESEAFAKAKELAQKALALDSSLAEGHMVLGTILFLFSWDFSTAERELKRSIELNPNSSTAQGAYAQFLAWKGRKEEAIVAVERSIDLDPNTSTVYIYANFVYSMLRLHDLAIERAMKAIELDPRNPSGHANLGLDYAHKGMISTAIRETREAVVLSGGSPFVKSNLGWIYGVSGNKEGAARIIAELIEYSNHQYVAALVIAYVYAGLGDADNAFEWLGKAFEEHSSYMPWLKLDAVFDPLRSDPRFGELLNKIGIVA